MSSRLIRIATRGSPLALAQSEVVRSALATRHPDRTFEIRVITTRGDRVRDRPLPEIGGKGLFTLELEEALRKGEAAMAVHSVKDLPTTFPPGLGLGCIPVREDPRDAFVSRDGRPLADLPPGSRVGTSSPRRRAQILGVRSDVEVVDLRGNVQTRIRKVREGVCDAAVLALAGLRRLGLEGEVTETLGIDRFLPPAGQGAIGIEIRDGDSEMEGVVSRIEDPPSRAEVDAEIAALQALGGGCQTPIGAVARAQGEAMTITVGVFSPDGRLDIRTEVKGSVSEAISMGKQAAADLLRREGARAILEVER